MTEVASAGAGASGDRRQGIERAFLIADVRGYTRFTREHGDAEAARLAGRFAELARDAVEARSGRVVELRGDEVLAVFDSASQAVLSARELAAVCSDEAAADGGLPLLVGAGIDVGEAVPLEGGFRGAALNTASRLCSHATVGQVLVTTGLAERADEVPGIRFEKSGSLELKGFDEPVEIVEAVDDAPASPIARPGPAGRRPLPLELEPDSPLVGREHELAWLRGSWRQVARGHGRMLVLSGASGIGKSRLATELAAFAWREGGSVSYAGAGGTAAATAGSELRAALAEHGPVLLVLDDLDAIATTLAPILADAIPEVEGRPVLVLCLLRDPELGPDLERLLRAVDVRGDGHRGLGPLDADGVRGIAALYAPDDVDNVPLESVARASEGVPARIHERMSEWAQQEAARRLTAAAEFLAAERRHRRADLAFANNAIGLKLGRIYAVEATTVDLGPGEAPYKGLAAFEESDAALFFGREQLVGELAARTVGAGLLAVVGASGSGKSSVIAAGLLPSLRAGLLPGSERWTTASIRPGEHPVAELSIVDTSGDERLVLVVDQFEEVFTLCKDEDERDVFVDRLAGLTADPDRYIVVVSIRGDYYGHCAPYPDLAGLVSANQVLVGPMSVDELRRAIELPGRRAGVRVESALTDALVEEIGDEPGGLPLLSTALVELWREREDDWLRLSVHQRLGGVRGAVARLAESSYENLSDEERDAARRLFLRLVATGDEGALARRRVPLSELDLDRDPALTAVVDRLTADRLLTAQGSSVEVAHEALLREWPRFQKWLAEDAQGRELREHLTESAKRWDVAGRDPAELYRGARLNATIDWAAGREQELNALEREFLAESRSHADLEAYRQRRQNRRLRGLLVGAAVLLVAAIVGGVVALQQRSSAQHQATVALGRQLGAEAVSQPRIDLSMLLARESLNLDRSPQTEGTLLATLLRSPAVIGTFALPVPGRPQEVKVSPDSRSVAAVTADNELRIYDTRTHQETRAMPIGNADYAYVPATGALFAAAEPNPAYLLVDPKTGRTLHTFAFSKLWLVTPGLGPEPVAVTHDGRYGFLVWTAERADGRAGETYIEGWRLSRNGHSKLVPTGTGLVVAAQTLADGRLEVAQSGQISTWDVATLKRISSVPGPRFGGGFAPAALSPDGRTLAYGRPDGTVRFFDIATGKTLSGKGAHSAGINRMSFSPDSRFAVSTADDGTAIVWNPRTGQLIQRLGGHSARVMAPDFSPNGKTLYTPGLDGTILQYDLGRSRRFGSPFSVGDGRARGFQIAAPPLLAMSPDGRTFAASVEQSSVGFFSTATLHRIAKISLAPTRNIFQGAWNGNRFVVGADKGLVQIWDIRGPRPNPIAVLNGLSKQGQVASVATGQGGRLIAAVDAYSGPPPKSGGPGQERGELGLWRDGKLVGGRTLELGTNGVWVAISKDGSVAAVAPDNGTVLIVDTRTGRVERTLRPPKADFIAALAFSHDGTLAAGGFSGFVSLWNPKTGKQIGHQVLVAEGPSGPIAFAPDGRSFATASYGGHSRLWETSTLQQLGSDFPGSEGFWGNVAYTPDGHYQIAVYGDGTAYRWPVTLSAWERQACAVAGRTFTTEEWSRFVGGRSYSKVCR
jgi:WD40 repeat protein/class 3 adenylate cyclase